MDERVQHVLSLDEFIESPTAERQGRAGSRAARVTRAPVRLRMTSTDVLCRRSMEVGWVNVAGERMHWSSSKDPACGWFEGEVLLPSGVTDIFVEFKVHTVVKSFNVSMVDRSKSNSWVRDEGSGKFRKEQFYFSNIVSVGSWVVDSSGTETVGVDVTFELRGTVADCHVWRCWNAVGSADGSVWKDIASRPPSERPAVLVAADTIAAPIDDFLSDGAPAEDSAIAMRRLVVAVRTLYEVHEETHRSLKEMDSGLTKQWFAVNSGNTLSAGLAIASAVTLFTVPPVGIGLGIGSAATGVATTGGDFVADQVAISNLRRQVSRTMWNSLAVAELRADWLRARSRAGETLDVLSTGSAVLNLEDIGLTGAQGVKVGATVAATIATIADESAMTGMAVGESAVAGARAAPAFARVFGVAGAVVSTGLAIHGWSNRKTLQTALRKRCSKIRASTLSMQRWLSAVNELECSICLCNVELKDEVRCCETSWHYSHARCIKLWELACENRPQGQSNTAACPLCMGPLTSQEGVLEDMVENEIADLTQEREQFEPRPRAATVA